MIYLLESVFFSILFSFKDGVSELFSVVFCSSYVKSAADRLMASKRPFLVDGRRFTGIFTLSYREKTFVNIETYTRWNVQL